MPKKHSLSATNLAVYQHLSCDLYIHNVYHGSSAPATDSGEATPSELSKAQYQRGLDWEMCLYSWLDQSGLLLKVPQLAVDPESLRANIEFDDRDHFFIAGLSFWPPQDELSRYFERFGTKSLNFGLAKPDLLEIQRTNSGVKWRVIDAKASKLVKTSHHIQIYFYSLCLQHLLSDPFFQFADFAGVWLPPADGFHSNPPSTEDIKTISTSLLAQPLNVFIFRDLPKIISLPHDKVKWHYNPLCQGCKFEPECRSRAVEEGALGSMPNISIDEARILHELLNISATSSFSSLSVDKLTDIEELHQLVATPAKLDFLTKYSAMTVKRSKRILALPKKQNPLKPILASPIVEASRTRQIQIIPRYNYTCPGFEDIAVIISVVNDPASPNPGGEFFCISTFSSKTPSIPSLISGTGKDLLSVLSNLLQSLTSPEHRDLTVQFYCWSSGEHALLQAQIIGAALTSSAQDDDVRLCIGALAQGASVLQTTFQPPLLSGALLSFLGRGRRSKAEYIACLERMGLPTNGTVEVLRKRVESEIREMQEQSPASRTKARQKELGQLMRVVVLKKEVERQIAIPSPGHWDLPECTSWLINHEIVCPSDEEIFLTYKKGDEDVLEAHLNHRNECMFSVLQGFRTYAVSTTGQSLFVNNAKTLSTKFMDLCREPNLRKLFFMQQFEVLSKLTDLWATRLQGCPDAVHLEYVDTVQGPKGIEHIFRLLSGNVDMSAAERDGFFDFILTGDTARSPRERPSNHEPYENIPVEALFDDLAVSGLVFPLNRWTKPQWELQDRRVQEELCVADIRNVCSDPSGRETHVSLRTWGNWSIRFEAGSTYRLSPRLIDFNTTKILSTLLEIDLRWGSEYSDLYEDDSDHRFVPYLQLILQPQTFAEAPNGTEYVKIENTIRSTFRELEGLQVKGASALSLKPSQHKATQRILSNRLAVIWGPPGTGKTYTITLSLLRLLEVQRKRGDVQPKIIFITAITHAAIDACCSKLRQLIETYRSIDGLPTGWLDDVNIDVVLKGNDHPAPPTRGSKINIYAGTIYQLWNFTKRHNFDVDCLIIDEAGQISLGAVSLVFRALGDNGRIIIAGDSQQLAPILSAQYPKLKSNMLFGSILDCLMFGRFPVQRSQDDGPPSSPGDAEPESTQGTVVQLTENFRLNPDLGEFVSTIYARQFKPQKFQVRQLAGALKSLKKGPVENAVIMPDVLKKVHLFFIALSEVMFKHPQSILRAPEITMDTSQSLSTKELLMSTPHRPVSLALLRLHTRLSRTDDIAYETHVRGEAMLAAALVACLQKAMPDEDIFVATPHRIQREAVKSTLEKARRANQLSDLFENLEIGDKPKGTVTVDTIERLQGSEAGFVICLFSLPRSFISDIGFLLERRRLNVAISRAKTLCLLITSDEVLCPSVKVLANEDTAKGYSFLKEFEKRAWSYDISVNVDNIAKSY